MSDVDLIAIDLDGTLVDSVKDLYAAVVMMQNALSLPLSSEESVRVWVGNGIERLVHRALTGDMQQDAERVLFDQALAGFKDAYAQTIGRYSTLYPGVLQGLEWIASAQVPMVLVTNKASAFAHNLVQQLNIDHFFAHEIGGDDVSAGKPDPEALILAGKLCAARPARSVLIGDSVSDFKAARAAGFHCVGVSYGYNHGISVRDLELSVAPAVVIDSFLELPGLLGRLAGASSAPVC